MPRKGVPTKSWNSKTRWNQITFPQYTQYLLLIFVTETVCWSKLSWSPLHNLEMLLHKKPSILAWPQQIVNNPNHLTFPLTFKFMRYWCKTSYFSFIMLCHDKTWGPKTCSNIKCTCSMVQYVQQGSGSNSFPSYYANVSSCTSI